VSNLGTADAVVGSRFAKRVYSPSSLCSDHCTIMACYSASGSVIPPLFIFQGKKKIGEDILNGAPAGSVVNISESGWINEDLFYQWLKFFVQSIPPSRPQMLIVDNHESRFSLRIIEFCQAENLRLVLLPPNATHLMQVGDVAIHSSFKKSIKEHSHKFLMSNQHISISKYEYCTVIGPAFQSAFRIQNIVSGYEATGIIPVNRNKVLEKLLSASTETEEKKMQRIVSFHVAKANKQDIEKILVVPGSELKLRAATDSELLRKRRALMPCTSLLSHSAMNEYFTELENDPDYKQKQQKKKAKASTTTKKKAPSAAPRKRKPKEEQKVESEINTPSADKENVHPNSPSKTTTSSSTEKIEDLGKRRRNREKNSTGLGFRTISFGDYEDFN
jgi:hypothetical protein